MFRACDRHSVEIMTLSKYVAEDEQMQKSIIEFLSKFQGVAMKLSELITGEMKCYATYLALITITDCTNFNNLR